MRFIIGDYYEVSLGDEYDSEFRKVVPLVSNDGIDATFRNTFMIGDRRGFLYPSTIHKKRIRKHLPKEKYPEYYL